MAGITHFDHVGVTVRDLDLVAAFFTALGLEVDGRTVVEGEFIDTVCGIPNARTEILMLRAAGGGTAVESSTTSTRWTTGWRGTGTGSSAAGDLLRG